VKDEKLTKLMKRTTLILWLLAQPLVRKSAGTTFNASYTKMALARSQQIFKPKRAKLFYQDVFCNGTMTPVDTASSGQHFKWQQSLQAILAASLFTEYCHRGIFFSLGD
jgi:hypothetical protein